MRLICITCVFMIVMGQLISQKQDYIWHFGFDSNNEPGAEVMQIDFNSGSFPITEISTVYGFHHNTQAICNSEGELLFYTNGCAIMNRFHEVMPNGDTLNQSSFKEELNWDNCSFGYPGTQNLIILSDPASEEGYYIFHKTILYDPEQIEDPFSVQLRNTYVDLSLEQGKGDVVYFDSILMENNSLSSYLSAIRHKNGRDWWLIQPLADTETISTFLVDNTGIHREENQLSNFFFQRTFSSASGTSRFSPDGKMYVYGNRFDNLHLYNFDRETGTLSNYKKIDVFPELLDPFSPQNGSLEWSPNSQFVYITDLDSLHQIDTWANDIEGNVEFIDEYDGTLNPFQTDFTMMALAPDCRIYVSSGSSVQSMHVIKHPNRKGKDCEFVQNNIRLPRTAGSMNIPLHTRWRVDKEEKCDPSLITSITDLGWEQKNLKIFPNPASDYVVLEAIDLRGVIYVYDVNGTKVLEQQKSEGQNINLDLHGLKSGNYIVEFIPQDRTDKVFYQGVLQVVR